MQQSTVTVPRWVIAMFTTLQPVITGALLAGVVLVFQMNNRLTVLGVQMEQALKTDDKLDTISDRINAMSSRLSRLEGQRHDDHADQ